MQSNDLLYFFHEEVVPVSLQPSQILSLVKQMCSTLYPFFPPTLRRRPTAKRRPAVDIYEKNCFIVLARRNQKKIFWIKIVPIYPGMEISNFCPQW